MKKINNKGFMMAEVVVVCAIIMTSLVGLYSSFNKMYKINEERTHYDNVDCIYALRTFYTYLVKNSDDKRNLIHDLITNINSDGYYIISGDSIFKDDEILLTLEGTYKIKNLVFVKYDESSVNNIKNLSGYNVTFTDYLDYLSGSLDFDEKREIAVNVDATGNTTIISESKYEYMLIIEIEDGDYDYYGYYRLT